MHPATGAIWENEHGPLGGDELNIILPGRNYGWPLVTFGTDYDGTKISDSTWRADLEAPFVYWVPSIAVSGLTFYTGDRFPAWKGNVFVGAMFQGRTRGTGHIQRIVINGQGVRSIASRCSLNCASASATCGRGPMACCTCSRTKTRACCCASNRRN